MSDEIQLSGWDTTRALCEADPIDLELRLNTGADDDSKVELVMPYSPNTTTKYHWPSEERLATANGAFSTAESINSGAELIGVKDNSWSTLTGDLDLQTILDEIDTTLSSVVAASNAILSDGSVDMDADWTANYKVTLPSTLGSEMLADTGFPSGSVGALPKSWQVDGTVIVDGTNKLTYDSSLGGGVGTITQDDSNMTIEAVDGGIYYMSIEVTNFSGTGVAYMAVSSAWALRGNNNSNNVINGNNTFGFFFKVSETGQPLPFILTVTKSADDDCSFDIDNITLKRYTGGVLQTEILDANKINMGGIRLEAQTDEDVTIMLGDNSAINFKAETGINLLNLNGNNELIEITKNAIEGQQGGFQLSGWRSGDSAKRTLELQADADEDDTMEWSGVSNYEFNGYLQATGKTVTGKDYTETLTGTALLSSGYVVRKPAFAKQPSGEGGSPAYHTIDTLTLENNKHYFIKAEVIYHSKNGTYRGVWQIQAHVYGDSGAATIVDQTEVYTDPSNTGSVVLDTSGLDILLDGQGNAASAEGYFCGVISYFSMDNFNV